jgi:hypothetical protein
MIMCYCCQQIGYIKETFKFFPKRDNSGYHAICMICVPYVEKSIRDYENRTGQTRLSDF